MPAFSSDEESEEDEEGSSSSSSSSSEDMDEGKETQRKLELAERKLVLMTLDNTRLQAELELLKADRDQRERGIVRDFRRRVEATVRSVEEDLLSEQSAAREAEMEEENVFDLFACMQATGEALYS